VARIKIAGKKYSGKRGRMRKAMQDRSPVPAAQIPGR